MIDKARIGRSAYRPDYELGRWPAYAPHAGKLDKLKIKSSQL